MPQTSPPRLKVSGNRPAARGGGRNLKLLVTTVSLTTTLGGWALLALNQTNTANVAAATDQSTPVSQPTAVPPPTGASAFAVPPLSSLPVRGLPVVGDPGQQGAAPQVVFNAPTTDGSGGSSGGGGGGGHAMRGGGGGGGGGAPPPAPAPKPKPVGGGGGHGSHPKK